MPGVGGPPASFLAPGSAWMDEKVAFATGGDRPLLAACQAVWELSAAIRATRGARGLSMSHLAAIADVRRQTLSDIEQGKVWPDVATVARLLRPLGLELSAARPVDQA